MSSKSAGERFVIKLGSVSGKADEKRVSKSSDDEKSERLARESLRNIIVFHAALEEEIQGMIAGE